MFTLHTQTKALQTITRFTTRNFSSGSHMHGSTVSRDLLPSMANNQNITHRIISGQHNRNLAQNIIISSKEFGWSHLELTKDHIRVEYDGPTEDYQNSAKLYFETDEEILAKGIPLCFKPIGIENGSHMGGGATIYLDRSEVADFLRENSRTMKQ